MKTAMLIAACTAAVSLAPAALAEPLHGFVEYERSDLASEQGLAGIKARIAQTAEDVCEAPSQPTLRERRQRMDCIEDAIAQAEIQLQRQVAVMNLRRLVSAEETAAG